MGEGASSLVRVRLPIAPRALLSLGMYVFIARISLQTGPAYANIALK